MIINAKTDTMGGRLKFLRYQWGYTLETVADAVGVSSMTVSKWERDKTKPKGDHLERLAILFQISEEFILTGKTELSSETEKFIHDYQFSDEYTISEKTKKYADMFRKIEGTTTRRAIVYGVLSHFPKTEIYELMRYIVDFLENRRD